MERRTNDETTELTLTREELKVVKLALRRYPRSVPRRTAGTMIALRLVHTIDNIQKDLEWLD